jgi:hypothetical protein
MTSTRWSLGVLLLLIAIRGSALLYGSDTTSNQTDMSASASSPQAADVKGTWSGTFHSGHAGAAPFTITVVVDEDSSGHLIGKSTLSHDCLRDLNLNVTVTGSKVSLAGSDQDGANITFLGTIDKTGTMLKLRYIVNGSASGRCESDNGTGNMGKR